MGDLELGNRMKGNSVYPKIIPATVAEIKEAMDPPNNAFMPNLERVFRCPGASEPMPPI